MTDLESRARQLYREIEATDQRDAEEMIRRALEEVVEACAVKAEDPTLCHGLYDGLAMLQGRIAAAIRGRKP